MFDFYEKVDELLPESIIFKYQLRMELLMLENVSWWKRFSEFQKTIGERIMHRIQKLKIA